MNVRSFPFLTRDVIFSLCLLFFLGGGGLLYMILFKSIILFYDLILS